MVDSPGAMKKSLPVPELQPLDRYDLSRAKTSASVRWLLNKAYGSAVVLFDGGVLLGPALQSSLIHSPIVPMLPIIPP
ncbi:hypothetical protein KUCAC02_034365, partial [Chaenocephalus aceratus]